MKKNKLTTLCRSGLWLLLLFPILAFPQTAKMPYHTEKFNLASDTHHGLKETQVGTEVRENQVVRVTGAPWIQLHFIDTYLGSGSYITITSAKDGASQTLDSKSLADWYNSSAYFNGGEIEIKLHVAPEDQDVRFRINELSVGDRVDKANTESQCGAVDNRVPSNDPAVGRILPVGCTGWISSNGKHISAGHCIDSLSPMTLQFNVPASLPDGTLQHPPPQDQYSMNTASYQYVNGAIGDDWGVFNVFNNSMTGLQPKTAQGSSFVLARNLTAPTIRITGFGVDSTATATQTQQTHAGPNVGSSGSILRYRADTEGGNSGSPVIDTATGSAIGVHTNGGCLISGGGSNSGTSMFNSAFWSAINSGSPTIISIKSKDRKQGSLTLGDHQWYSFNSTRSQKLSIQTNGFFGDTVLDLYKGPNLATASLLDSDDDGGPNPLFSNIRFNISSGPHWIRVRGYAGDSVDLYYLRLMSNRDILSFNDTFSHFAKQEIRVMSSAGITGGCGTNQYCPADPVTRAQMAIFMLKAILGGNHNSPPASGTVFSDVSTSSFGASFIEEFSTLGITSGCGGGKYCPDLAVTREQMAVFLLRAWYGSSYTPPAATPAEINQFSDIANSFARDWIVQLTKENITGGCGGGKYCPTDTVTRGQMAAFIARTFDLDVEL